MTKLTILNLTGSGATGACVRGSHKHDLEVYITDAVPLLFPGHQKMSQIAPPHPPAIMFLPWSQSAMD